jgi:hypothetical protein
LNTARSRTRASLGYPGDKYEMGLAAIAHALADALWERRVPVFAREHGMTQSHQFAVEAGLYGGGQGAAKLLARANMLSCGIGVPVPPVAGDTNGLRLGTPEIVRWDGRGGHGGGGWICRRCAGGETRGGGEATRRDGVSGAVHKAEVCAVGWACATGRATPGSSPGAWIASSLRSSQ